MRIAVSGSHGSGKSTLIGGFVARHPEYVHEPEPYEWLAELRGDAFAAESSAADFWQQLELSVERLASYPAGSKVIAERSPLDFVAYLQALRDLRREDTTSLLDAAFDLAGRGMEHLDLLAVLPLNDIDDLDVPQSEDPELREAMDACLLEIIGGAELHGVRVVEIAGTETQRLAALERALREFVRN